MLKLFLSLFRIDIRLSGRHKCHLVRLPWYQVSLPKKCLLFRFAEVSRATAPRSARCPWKPRADGGPPSPVRSRIYRYMVTPHGRGFANPLAEGDHPATSHPPGTLKGYVWGFHAGAWWVTSRLSLGSGQGSGSSQTRLQSRPRSSNRLSQSMPWRIALTVRPGLLQLLW